MLRELTDTLLCTLVQARDTVMQLSYSSIYVLVLSLFWANGVPCCESVHLCFRLLVKSVTMAGHLNAVILRSIKGCVLQNHTSWARPSPTWYPLQSVLHVQSRSLET